MATNTPNPFAHLETFMRGIAQEEAASISKAEIAILKAENAALSNRISGLRAATSTRSEIRAELDSMAAEARNAIVDSVQGHARPYVGGVDPRFVETSTAKSIARAMKAAKAADRWLVIVSGPAGTGKTFPALQNALRTGSPVYPVEVSEATTLDDLFVRPWTGGAPGTMTWNEGPAVRAAKEGGILLLDECDLASPRLIGGLHGLLESGQTRLRSGEWLRAHPDFLCIATCNSLRNSRGSYSTHSISTAFADRAVFVASEYLPEADEVAILSRYGSAEAARDTRDDLVALRVLFENGGLKVAPSTRRGAVVVAALSAGASRAEAWGLAMVDGLDRKMADEIGRLLAAAQSARHASEINRGMAEAAKTQSATA